jgi:hypothetical protein
MKKKFLFVNLRKTWLKFYQNPDPHSTKMLDPDPYPDPHITHADQKHCRSVRDPARSRLFSRIGN